MELDEFKAHWNTIQDKEFQQQKISSEKLEQIIMNTTDTLNQLQAESIFWNKLGKPICQVLIGALIVVLMITLGEGFYNHSKLNALLVSVVYFAIMVIYAGVTIWVNKRQEQIFTIYKTGSLKDTLKQTATAFRKFYLMLNTIYLFLYPAFFYSVIKLLIPYWHASTQTVLITCAAATIIFLTGGHWYYTVKFLKKLKALEADFECLEGEQI